MAEFGDEMTTLLSQVALVAPLLIVAYKETIEQEAAAFTSDLIKNIPLKTGGLRASCKQIRATTGNRAKYGYQIVFDGYNSRGVAYQKIANTLNIGTSNIKPRRFIDNAVKKLKGLDARAFALFEQKVKELLGEDA